MIDQDVDHITSSLDSLQGILSGPQFNLDAETLLQVCVENLPRITLQVDSGSLI